MAPNISGKAIARAQAAAAPTAVVVAGAERTHALAPRAGKLCRPAGQSSHCSASGAAENCPPSHAKQTALGVASPASKVAMPRYRPGAQDEDEDGDEAVDSAALCACVGRGRGSTDRASSSANAWARAAAGGGPRALARPLPLTLPVGSLMLVRVVARRSIVGTQRRRRSEGEIAIAYQRE